MIPATHLARSTRCDSAWIGAVLLGALIAAGLSIGPASAQTQAICKQEYLGKKAASETPGQSQASYIKSCLEQAKATPQPPVRPAAPGAGGSEVGVGSSDADLAKQLANPVANLISVPLQNNLDYGGGAQRAGSQYTVNIQPVIPIKLTNDWNLITRTIVPLTDVVHIVPGTNPAGMGDILQSFFFSPAEPVNGVILGAGPVFLYPTATRDEISANQFAAGPTLVALKQQNGFTIGILANHLWGIGNLGSNGLGGGSILGDDGSTIVLPPGQSARVNASYLQPFFSYTTPKQTTFTLQTESTYNWTAHQWTVPFEAGVSQVLKIGSQPISIAAMGKYWAVRPDGAPSWGARFVLTFLFPK